MSKKKAKKKPTFEDFLQRNAKGRIPSPLPLVHSSRSEFLKSFQKNGKLKPRRCPVFGEKLLYFFYGRPSYRPRPNGLHQIGYCPICFVMRLPSGRMSIDKVLPLDSGAANDGRFEPHIKATELASLQLTPNLDSAQQIIQVFYRNNRDYFLGRTTDASELSFKAGELAARYFDLLTDPSIEQSDDRRSAVEVVSSSQLSLRNNIQAVILPERFLDDEQLRKTVIEDWSALPITYPTWQATCPAEYSRTIQLLLLEFLERHKIVRTT